MIKTCRPALFGGSFDPLHIGHLHIADAALSGGRFDAVFFIPAFRSPHKADGYGAPDSARLEMVRSSIDRRERMYLLSWELERPGPSYTIDTLEQFIREYDGDESPGLLVGDDLLEHFHTWERYKEILAMATLVIGGRPEADPARMSRSQRLEELGARYVELDNAAIAVSASDIRRRVASGLPYRDLVPETVYEIIEMHQLYR